MGRDVPNAIALAEVRVRREGRALRSLNDSNPTRHGLAPDCLPGQYLADPRGPLSSRTAIAGFLSSRGDEGRVDPNRVYVLDSTSQAYAWLFMLMCDPSDSVLAPKPGYPLIESIASLTCVNVEEYQLRYDGSWTVDVADIERILRGPRGQRIRALVVINPNNPTGSYLHEGERDAILALCREFGLALIADEVFYPYSLEPLPGRRRLAGEDGVLTFGLDGLSKSLAAPHAKVGWIQVSGPRDAVNEALPLLDRVADDFLPVGACVDARIPGLLQGVDAQTERVSERTRGNLTALRGILDDDRDGLVSLLRPEGGWNVLVRIPATIDEDDVVLTLLRDYGITGQPGYFFDMPANGYLALSLLPEPRTFIANVTALLDVVGRLAGQTL